MSAFVWQPGRTRIARTRCCPAPTPKSSKYLLLATREEDAEEEEEEVDASYSS